MQGHEFKASWRIFHLLCWSLKYKTQLSCHHRGYGPSIFPGPFVMHHCTCSLNSFCLTGFLHRGLEHWKHSTVQAFWQQPCTEATFPSPTSCPWVWFSPHSLTAELPPALFSHQHSPCLLLPLPCQCSNPMRNHTGTSGFYSPVQPVCWAEPEGVGCQLSPVSTGTSAAMSAHSSRCHPCHRAALQHCSAVSSDCTPAMTRLGQHSVLFARCISFSPSFCLILGMHSGVDHSVMTQMEKWQAWHEIPMIPPTGTDVTFLSGI